MAVLYDARGNEIRCGVPDSVNGETITDARTAVTTIGAANAEVVMDLNGASIVSVDMRSAACSATLVFEGTIDGSNYIALPAWAITQALAAVLTSGQFVPSVIPLTTISAQYIVDVVGFRRFRVRMSAYVSGNIAIAMRGTSTDFMAYSRLVPSNLMITATAAANTAAVATLPAAGVGMFHYITSITIMRSATAALVGTATLIHTSTNLPGNPAWSVGNAMVAGGSQLDVNFSPTTPLRSSVANTNTTVTAVAAGAAVLGRVNVSYYVGY